MLRAHLLVHGDVQGVNYRWLVQSAARELGLRGWVKNLPGGDVEILCESDTEKAYREFLERISVNDAMRRVEKIDVLGFEKGAEKRFDSFRIEH
ncbi:MAG: acylphosphatase [Candidatus Micrarchaeota archaeon]